VHAEKCGSFFGVDVSLGPRVRIQDRVRANLSMIELFAYTHSFSVLLSARCRVQEWYGRTDLWLSKEIGENCGRIFPHADEIAALQFE
jgi:hypothetical protein